MKINMLMVIVSLLAFGKVASADDCTTADHAQIMAGLVARSMDKSLPAGERGLADVMGAEIRKEGGYKSCVKDDLRSSDSVYLVSTSNIQASIRFSGPSIVEIQAIGL